MDNRILIILHQGWFPIYPVFMATRHGKAMRQVWHLPSSTPHFSMDRFTKN